MHAAGLGGAARFSLALDALPSCALTRAASLAPSTQPVPHPQASHLLKYDSTLGKFDAEVKVIDDSHISVNGKSIKVVSSRDPTQLPWKVRAVSAWMMMKQQRGLFAGAACRGSSAFTRPAPQQQQQQYM